MKKYDYKNLALDILFDIISGIIYTIGIYSFVQHAKISVSGISGLAISINYIFSKLSIGTLVLMLNVPVVLLSYKVLGKIFLLKSLKTTVISSVLLDYLGPLLPKYEGDMIISAIFGGLLMGLALVIVYMRGTSTGGTDFLILSIQKLNPHFSVGKISFTIDFITISIGAIVYKDISAFLYGAITIYIVGVVIDKVMYGTDAGKLMLIVTTKARDVAKNINEVTSRGSTIIKIKGAYSYEDKEMVVSAMSKREVFKARRIVNDTDTDSFIMITGTDEVFGEGFKTQE